MVTDNDSLMLQLIRKLYSELVEYESDFETSSDEQKFFEYPKYAFIQDVYKGACNVLLNREEIVALLCTDDILECCWIENEDTDRNGAYTLISVAKHSISEERYYGVYST